MTTTEHPDTSAGNDGFIWSREQDASQGLREGIVNALLIMAGIIGAGGLLYFRAQVWAWAVGDPVEFAVVLVVLLIGSLLTIRAARERNGQDRDGVEP